MRSLGAVVAIVGVVLTSAVLVPVQWLAVKFDIPLARHLPRYWHRALCRILGLRIELRGRPALDRPLLITANHASWLDIPVIGSVVPAVFVAKAEVAAWPVFGMLSRLQRTIYVDRSRRSHTGRSAAEIAHRLADGDPIVLFAEGTSSDGNRVLGFRSALIGATREVMACTGDTVAVQPLAIAYVARHGMPLGRFGRPDVAWYGDMEMVPHLWRFLKLGPVDVVLHFAEPIAVDGTSDRKVVARQAEAVVRRIVGATLRGR